MKNKVHSLIVEGVLFCGSGLGLLSYSLISYGKAFNKSWAQSPYLFPLIVGAAMTGLSIWLMGEGIQAARRDASENTAAKADKTPAHAGAPKAIDKSQMRGVAVALVMCGVYYLALAELKIPYITIGILSFMYTFSTFEVATVVFLAAMMGYMGVRKLPVLVCVPLGTTLFLSIVFRALLHVLLP